MNRLASNGHGDASEFAAPVKPTLGFTAPSTGMDIARPDLARQRRRRRLLWAVIGVGLLTLVSVLLARLEPAVPSVERSTLWTNSVQRGEMLRQVRGNGTLVPEQIQFVQAETGGTVERIFIQPGAEVTADSVILELSNPELKQQAFDAEWAAKAAVAQLAKLTVTLESERLAQESSVVTLRADAKQALLERRANEVLAKDGLVPGLEMERAKAKAEDLAARVVIEEKRLKFTADSAKSQLAVQEAEVEKLGAVRDLRRRQVGGLLVKAGIAGVLSQLGDREVLQSGQRVAPSATLAKVVVPTRLKAEIRVAETQAKDVTRGQKVGIDTRNGMVPGQVVRVDPAVQNGTVLVEVKLDGPLPKGARPDLSVEGTIELERLTDVLFVGRPVQGQPESTVGLFKLTANGSRAERVPVKLGRSSVSFIEILDGLKVGDIVILNDMSQYDSHNRLRLN
jgi:HlyD family secretion protein